MRKIVVLGAGGLASEVLNLLEENNLQKEQWEILGCLDAAYDPEHPRSVLGYPILGNDSWAEKRREPICAVCAVGDPAIRKKMIDWYRSNCPAVSFPPIIHKKASVTKYSSIGAGVIICNGSQVSVETEIGDFSIVDLACTVSHGSKIGAFSTVHPASNISGNVNIGDLTEIGTGTKIIQGVHIGDRTIIGAGSVVVRDIPESVVAFGVPCRVVRKK